MGNNKNYPIGLGLEPVMCRTIQTTLYLSNELAARFGPKRRNLVPSSLVSKRGYPISQALIYNSC